MVGSALISNVGNKTDISISQGQGNCVLPISPGHLNV